MNDYIDEFLEIEMIWYSRFCPHCESEEHWDGEVCDRCGYPYSLEDYNNEKNT